MQVPQSKLFISWVHSIFSFLIKEEFGRSLWQYESLLESVCKNYWSHLFAVVEHSEPDKMGARGKLPFQITTPVE